MPRFLIEGSSDGSMFAEAIDADNLEQAESGAIDRLCEAWGVTRTPETTLWDLGDAATVSEYAPEDYARDAASDMLAFVDQIGHSDEVYAPTAEKALLLGRVALDTVHRGATKVDARVVLTAGTVEG